MARVVSTEFVSDYLPEATDVDGFFTSEEPLTTPSRRRSKKERKVKAPTPPPKAEPLNLGDEI